MKNLITRSITGTLYVVFILGSIVLGQYWFAGLFLVISSIANWEFNTMISNHRIIPYKPVTIIAGIVLYASNTLIAFDLFNFTFLLINVPFISAILIAELFRRKEDPFGNIAYSIIALLYVVLPLSFLNYLYNPGNLNTDTYPELLTGFFIILWVYDSGAYLFGKLLGKHKLFERISPGKTWEGCIGGALASIGVAYLFSLFFQNLNLVHWLIISVIIIIFGTFGDLVESLLKRSAKVKDSAKILPGHGGFLDRLDSVLISAPMVYAYVMFIFNIL